MVLLLVNPTCSALLDAKGTREELVLAGHYETYSEVFDEVTCHPADVSVPSSHCMSPFIHCLIFTVLSQAHTGPCSNP